MCNGLALLADPAYRVAGAIFILLSTLFPGSNIHLPFTKNGTM